MQSHLNHPGKKKSDRLQVQNSRKMQTQKGQGHKTAVQSASDLERPNPQKPTPLATHYNDFDDTAHTPIPCIPRQRRARRTWDVGNRKKLPHR